MGRFTTVSVLAVGALLLTVLTASASQSAATQIEDARLAWSLAHPALDFDASVAYQQAFRSEFDFAADDEATIATAMVYAEDNGSFEKYGLHLTDDEFAELERRGRISQELSRIKVAFVGTGLSEEDLHEDPALTPQDVWGSAFAGSWIDQHEGGRLRIAVVGGSKDATAATLRASGVVDDLVRGGSLSVTDFELVPAEFSYADLVSAQEQWVDGATKIGALSDARGFASDIDLQANQLVVFYGSDSQLEYAEEFVRSMPDGMVRIGGQGPTVREISNPASNHDWPHAGLVLHVEKQDSTSPVTCTWGLTARTSSYVYAITAAHCSPYRSEVDNPPSYWEWENYTISTQSGGYRHDAYHGTRDVSEDGYTFGRHWQSGDIMRIMITEWHMDDYDCYHSGSDCGTQIVRRELTSETEVNETKCASLPQTSPYYICSTLTSNNYQIGNRTWIRRTNHNLNDAGGDSGAGLKESTLATGILGAELDDDGGALWTHAYYVENTLGVTICGTSGVCN